MKTHIIVVTLGLIFAGAIASAAELAKVGSVAVDDKPLKLWADSQSQPNMSTQYKDMRYFGLAQEIRSELGRQIAAKYKISVSDDAIVQFAEQNEKGNQQFAENYKRILKLANNDKVFYARTLYTTQYIDSQLRSEVFRLKSGEFSASVKAEAEKVIKKLQGKSGDFKAIAKSHGYATKAITASAAKGIRSEGKEREQLSLPHSVASDEAEKAGTALKKGDIYDKVIEAKEYFLVLKSKGSKTDGEPQFDAMLVKKLSFEDWFWSEAGKIPVSIPDKKLKAEIMERALWAKKVKMK